MFKEIHFHRIIIFIAIICVFILGYFLREVSYAEKIETEFYKVFREIDIEQSQQQAGVAESILPGAIDVPILIYHSISPHRHKESRLVKYYDVSPESFEKELIYLRDNGYNVIPLGDLVDSLYGKKSLLPKSVVITIDDGWHSQYKYAFPLLKKYHDTATFFIFTNAPGAKYYMNWDEIREMDKAGMTIGGHTKSHPYLVEIKDPARLKDEIIGGKKILEEHLGKTVNLFAYPFGHYTNEIISIVKEAGYKSARSTYKGTHHTTADLYTLKGREVTDDFDSFVKIFSE